MLEDRLVSLTLLSIENDILRELNCDDIIDEFAKENASKGCVTVSAVNAVMTMCVTVNKFMLRK